MTLENTELKNSFEGSEWLCHGNIEDSVQILGDDTFATKFKYLKNTLFLKR